MIALIKRVFGWLPEPAGQPSGTDEMPAPPPHTLDETSPLVVEAHYAHRVRRDKQARLEEAYGEFLNALKVEDDLRSR